MVPRPERTKLSFSSMVNLNPPSCSGAFAQPQQASHHTHAHSHTHEQIVASAHPQSKNYISITLNMLLTAGRLRWSDHIETEGPNK